MQMKRLYEAAQALRGITGQSELARAMNLSPQTVNNWEARGISKAGMLSAQALLGCSATWLATGGGEMAMGGQSRAAGGDESSPFIDTPPEKSGTGVRIGDGPPTVPIRAVKLRLQAGVSGFVAEPDMDIDHGYFQVPKDVIDSLGLNPADLIVMSVTGRSMEPMMFEDDKVLVDTSKRIPINNECFAVNWDGEPIVKCLIKKGDNWSLYSMNRDPRYHTIDVRTGQCSIIGLVVWQPARIITGRI